MTPIRALTCLVVLLAACRPAPVAPDAPTPAPAVATIPTNPYDAVELNGVYTVRRKDVNWVGQHDYATCEEAQQVAARMWFYTTNVTSDDTPEFRKRQLERAQMPWQPCVGGGQ